MPAFELLIECTGFRTSHVGMSLVVARRDFLVVGGFSSQRDGGAHPMNNGRGTTAINLTDGHSIGLDDLVDARRLRDVAAACLPVYARAASASGSFELPPLPPASCGNEGMEARYLWACDKDDLPEPSWALLPEGIVIGSWANPRVIAALDGQGPILSWGVLKREGVLKAASPMAHLWANVPPADAAAPACTSAYEGDSLRIWRER